MSPWSEISIPDALIFFFLTLGPLRAIAPFAQLTQGTDPAFRRAVAWRATATATITVLVVALLGSLVLENWHVSIAAVIITGSIILFCQALQLIMQPLTGPRPPRRALVSPRRPWPLPTFPWPFPAWSRLPALPPLPRSWLLRLATGLRRASF